MAVHGRASNGALPFLWGPDGILPSPRTSFPCYFRCFTGYLCAAGAGLNAKFTPGQTVIAIPL